jgi:hypothetical protein
MKLRIFIIISFLISIDLFGQTEYDYWVLEQRTPSWALTAFQQLNLNDSLRISDFLNPFYFEEDFNGDSQLDIAVLIEHKSTLKKGILILHGQTKDFLIIGAGKNFNNRFDDVSWMDVWKLYRRNTSTELTYEDNLDIEGAKTITVHNPSLELIVTESASGLIYWNGEHYKWSQKSE